MVAQRWRLLALAALWAGAVPVLRLTLVGSGPRTLPALAALATAVAAALLGAVGWGARSPSAAPPPWRRGVWVGAALLVLGTGSALLAATGLPALAPLAVAAFAAHLRWAERGLPPGFAHRLTGAARTCGLAAACALLVALPAGPAALALLPARSMGGAIYLGAGPLGLGTILWEYVRPHLGRSRRGRTRAG